MRDTSRPTLASIAADLGLSKSTVTAILGNRPDCYASQAVRSRVLEHSRQVGYRRNLGAALLRGQKLRQIAIIYSESGMQFWEHLQVLTVKLISDYSQTGYTVNCDNFGLDGAANLMKVERLMDQGVAKFIFLGQPVDIEQIIASVTANKREYVLYSPLSTSRYEWMVTSDTGYGIQLILEHLGLTKNITCLMPSPHLIDSQRFKAISKYFGNVGLETLLDRNIIHIASKTLPHCTETDYISQANQVGRETATQVLTAHPQTEALIFPTDIHALGALPVVIEFFQRTGHWVKLAGYNYNNSCRDSLFPIISVEHDISALASALIRPCDQWHGLVSVKPILRDAADKYDFINNLRRYS